MKTRHSFSERKRIISEDLSDLKTTRIHMLYPSIQHSLIAGIVH